MSKSFFNSVTSYVISALLSLAFVGSWAQAQSYYNTGADTPFTSLQVDKVIVMPDAKGHVDWINAIRNARSRIHMTMYHLTDKSVIDALVAKAKDSSVDIRVIVDGKSLKGGYAKAIQDLQAGGVNVRGSSPAFSLTHSKDVVIDNEAFIGAVDLTNTATRMRDFTLETPDAQVIAEVESVFEADWQNAQDKQAYTPPVNVPDLVWSPINSDAKLLQMINSAKTSIVAETENFDNTDIITAFNQAAARGVHVRLITPQCSFGNADLNYQGVAQLMGVDVHMEADGSSIAQPYMHSKMMVVDGQLVYLGSINLSFNSIKNDRELGLIFYNQQTADQLSQEFETDWNRSQVPGSSSVCQKAGNF